MGVLYGAWGLGIARLTTREEGAYGNYLMRFGWGGGGIFGAAISRTRWYFGEGWIPRLIFMASVRGRSANLFGIVSIASGIQIPFFSCALLHRALIDVLA